MTTVKLIVDYPSRNPDLIYKTRFAAPDPCLFFEYRGRTHLIVSNLEIDRARKEAKVDLLLSLSACRRAAQAALGHATDVDVLDHLFRARHVRRILVPDSTGAGLVDRLRARRYRVTTVPAPFYPKRLRKTAAEKRAIDAAQRAVFRAIRCVERVLAASVIRKDQLLYRGAALTTEIARAEAGTLLLREGYAMPEGLIIAGGAQAIDPHERGHGPLRPHEAIIVDASPRSERTHFFGDATRTFCRGAAPPALKKLYAAVRAAQRLGIGLIRAGVNGRTVHRAIVDFFERLGYRTGMMRGRCQGFFHSTGHGIGLELHEIPQRISAADYPLRAGHVFTVEPGLYYAGIGGVRIEDIVYVTKRGCEILGGRYPRRLEIL
ncbi:MAG: aminopeptidase P family protein [Deltaproteobacteria bacterium]|nr:aminopeptidase P family protein [Deltaproteobacteria bacterium]